MVMNERNDLNEKKKPSFFMNLWDWIKSFLFALVIALVVKAFIFEPTQVQGSSMEATLHTGDRVIVNKVSLKFNELKRGDIVVLHFNPTDEDYIKRVIGLPGDTIQLIDGFFYIDAKKLTESYAFGDYTYPINQNEWVLGEGEYFVVGDNRKPGASKDSRDFGPVNIKDIKGVATLRFYPFGESFGRLK